LLLLAGRDLRPNDGLSMVPGERILHLAAARSDEYSDFAALNAMLAGDAELIGGGIVTSFPKPMLG